MLPLLVLDASAALALILSEDEGCEVEALVREIIESNGQIYVPDLFPYEFGNGLISAFNRHRISLEELNEIIRTMMNLPLVFQPCRETLINNTILSMAIEHTLTFYDAAYLELAVRHGIRLKSFDRHIISLQDRFPEIIL
jgi:predicted nucleic acid-binding protein